MLKLLGLEDSTVHRALALNMDDPSWFLALLMIPRVISRHRVRSTYCESASVAKKYKQTKSNKNISQEQGVRDSV